MTDTSLVHPRVEHMPAAAVALAVLLHVVVGAGLWRLAPLQPTEQRDDPIMLLFDSSPSNVGLQLPERIGPPPESVAASPLPSREPQREEEQQQALARPQPSAPSPAAQVLPRAEPVPTVPIYELSVPSAPEAPPALTSRDVRVPPNYALSMPPAPEAPPAPTSRDFATLPIFEFSVPPPQPPPAPTSRDFPKPLAAPARPVQRTQPMPPRPGPPAQDRPPTDSPASMPAPLPGPDPADLLAGQGRQRNDYLSRIFRHLEPYRVSAHTARAANQRGRVVTRVTLARDGGLVDVSIDSPSGRPALDAAELAAIRNAAPFPPVPANMPGDPVILILRMTY